MTDQATPNPQQGQDTQQQPDPQPAPQSETPQAQDDQQQAAPPATWEDFLEQQPEAIQTLYSEHTNGLRSALQSERSNNRDLTRQLNELTGQLEEGSDARQRLEEISTQLQEAEARAAFLEGATAPGVNSTNPGLLWLAYQQRQDEFTRRGNPDFAALQEAFPELFRKAKPAPRTNAGSGAGQQPNQPANMNDILRNAARGNLSL